MIRLSSSFDSHYLNADVRTPLAKRLVGTFAGVAAFEMKREMYPVLPVHGEALVIAPRFGLSPSVLYLLADF